jgi:DNA-binding response OmpR family regulator
MSDQESELKPDDKPRILLVQDDDALCRSMELMLREAGYNVYATDLGEDAVDLAKTYEYEVIILDTGLPDISGYQALRDIRAAGVNAPILMMIFHRDAEANTKIYEMGADAVMEAPFNKQEFIALVNALRRRWTDYSGRRKLVRIADPAATIHGMRRSRAHLGRLPGAR